MATLRNVNKPIITQMLRSKFLFSSLNRAARFNETCLSTGPGQKILGYKEKPHVDEITADYIGPPDTKSNIRPILRHIPDDETKLQAALRLRRKEVFDWVDKFWRNHNYRFKTEKDEFILKHKTPEQEAVPADKMSEFYKDFLDKNWRVHVYFNLSWYIKNFELLFLAIQVNLQSGFRKLRGK